MNKFYLITLIACSTLLSCTSPKSKSIFDRLTNKELSSLKSDEVFWHAYSYIEKKRSKIDNMHTLRKQEFIDVTYQDLCYFWVDNYGNNGETDKIYESWRETTRKDIAIFDSIVSVYRPHWSFWLSDEGNPMCAHMSRKICSKYSTFNPDQDEYIQKYINKEHQSFDQYRTQQYERRYGAAGRLVNFLDSNEQ